MNISVIITAYKDRGFLDQCIQSVISQQFVNYEVLLCSDGNPEIEKYAKKYNIPFHLFEHGGNVAMLNSSVAVAKGEWIKIINDDDYLRPDGLWNLYNYTKDCSLVYGDTEYNINSSSRMFFSPASVTWDDLYPFKGNRINWASILINKQALIEVGGFDHYCLYSYDYALYLALLSKGHRFCHCPEIVAAYRIHKNQCAGNNPGLRARDMVYLDVKYSGKWKSQL